MPTAVLSLIARALFVAHWRMASGVVDVRVRSGWASAMHGGFVWVCPRAGVLETISNALLHRALVRG